MWLELENRLGERGEGGIRPGRRVVRPEALRERIGPMGEMRLFSNTQSLVDSEAQSSGERQDLKTSFQTPEWTRFPWESQQEWRLCQLPSHCPNYGKNYSERVGGREVRTRVREGPQRQGKERSS